METVDLKLPSELMRVAILKEVTSHRKPRGCWPWNFIERIRSRSDVLLSYAILLWRLSWILRPDTVFPRCATALRTWERNARLLAVSKRDRRRSPRERRFLVPVGV